MSLPIQNVNQNEGLKRELGVFDVAINVVNITIASGIFLLPAFLAAILGNASVVAYAMCGLMFLLVALCFAEAGSRVTTSGGAYAYIETAFGPFIGFIANGIFWLGYGTLAAAALINAIADMLSVPFPIFTMLAYRGTLFAVLFTAFAYINIRGIRQGMIAVKLFTLVKMLPLISLILVGIFAIKADNLTWNGFPTFDKLGEASLVLFFGLAGGETALNISGEMKNPNRTGPLGLVIGVIALVCFYSLTHIVAQGILGETLISNTKAPLAAVALKLAGPMAFSTIIACAVVCIIGSVNSIVLVFPRIIYAGAKDKLLPAFLARPHPRYATPHWAIIIFTVISFLMAVSGGFKQLLILATTSMLLLFIGVVLAVIKFRITRQLESKQTFKMPGGLLLPLITLLMLTWFIFQSKWNEVIGTSIFIAVLALCYLLKIILLDKKTTHSGNDQA